MKFSTITIYTYLSMFIGCLWTPTQCLFAQVQVGPPDRYRIEFTDKNHNDYTIDQPQFFLSERALQRRSRQGITITQADIPVSSCYIDSLKQMGIEVLNTSRWFNSSIIRCSPDDIEKLQKIDFIKHTPEIPRDTLSDTIVDKGYNLETLFSFLFQKKKKENDKSLYDAPVVFYGQAVDQVGMMNGQALHNRGFRGKGMLIAVIDGGFYKVNELSGFDCLRHSGRLHGIRNFTPETDDDEDDDENSHGTNVLSIIACNLPGRMMGSAPDAEYVLLRSEESATEYLVEEDNWITAVEYADSLGVDVITSSLGYTLFDDVSQNHRHDDLDGHTVRASYAATMAAARGMIVCVSAGNDGDNRWKLVSVPADADSVVTVGAVDRKGQYVAFSSVGYTADKRIKPDLMAMGRETAYQSSMGNIQTGNGTSYSTPLLAGMISCLWQAYPNKGNMDIIDMVKRSASYYNQPDTLYGYGIPDFTKLIKPESLSFKAKNTSYTLSVHSDMHTGGFRLHLSPALHGRINIRIRTVIGQQIFSKTDYVSGYDALELLVDGSRNFPSGTYMVEARTDAGKITTIAVK